MALQKLDPREAEAGMRAIKAVITADGPMLDVQRSTMELAQRYVLPIRRDVDALEPIEPEDLARIITAPDLRHQLVQVMCAYVLLGKDVHPAHIQAIQRYARAFDISEPSVDHLRYLIEDRLRLLKLDFRRRFAVGDAFKGAYRARGLRGIFDTAMQLAGHAEDPALLARFEALGDLPEGTLGRELFTFYRDNAFAFPGEKGGTPLPLLTHDLVHVLAGHDTSVLGEARTLALQTGFKREKPLMFVFLLLFQIQVGVEMVALAKGVGARTGFFDEEGVMEEMFKAYSRGAAMSADLFDGSWDYWADFDRPLAELRVRFGLSPS